MRITTVDTASASTNGEASAQSAGPPVVGDAAAANDKNTGTTGDASAPASTAVGPPKTKPKRPLSGYNLFYRYKRLKVLEATSKARRGRPLSATGAASGLDDPDDAALIRAVLVALPGLESLPPSSPIWSLTRPRLDEARCANIRKDMEGRLFPNENARNRLHRKVHGMGFVEMGKTMRDMWAMIDPATKDVFCDLADVGRVRYRMLLAEFRAGQAAAGVSGGGGKKKKEGKKQSYEKANNTGRVKKACPPSKGAGAATMTTTTTSTLTPQAGNNPSMVLPGLVPPTPQAQAYAHRRDSVLSVQSLQPLSVHSVSTRNPQQDSTFQFGRRVTDTSLVLNPSGGRRASTNSMASSMASLNMMMAQRRATTNSMAPLPLPSRRGSTDSISSLGMSSLNVASRWSSTDSAASLDAMSGECHELQELQQFLVRNAQRNAAQAGCGNNVEGVDGAMQMQLSMLRDLQQLQDLQALQRRRELQAQNNSNSSGMNSSSMNVGGILPPPLFQPQAQQQQPLFADATSASRRASVSSAWTGAGSEGLSVCPADVLSNNNTNDGKVPAVDAQGKDVSAQDFMDFIGQLDEAIDHDCYKIGAQFEGTVENAVEGQGPNPGPSIGPDQDHHQGTSVGNQSFIFGQPVNNTLRGQDGQKGGGASAVPMPAAYALHSRMARMA